MTVVDGWPLVGRRLDLARMLDAATDGRRCGAAVIGAAGVGKSRLLSKAAVQLNEAGWPTRWLAVCESGVDTPLAALAEYAPSRDGAELRETMRDAAVALRQLSQCAGRRVVLVVDDAHLLDDASSAIVHGLARDGAVALLLSLADDVPVPHWVQGLIDDTRMGRVELQPFDRAELEQLATEVLGGPLSSLLRQELWRLSRGLPRVARALLSGGQEDGLLARADGRWHHTGPLTGSRAVGMLIDAELERLTEPERTAVELLALTDGAEFDLIARLVGDEAVASLEHRRTVEFEESGERAEVRIPSALLSDSVRYGLTRSRWLSLARRLADELENSRKQHGDDARRVALWPLDGGRPPDTDGLLQSSAGARARLKLDIAERLARAAFQQRRCWRTHLHLAKSLSLKGDADQADRLLVTAAEHAHTDDARLHLAIARADNLLFTAGRVRSAIAVLDEARDTLAAADASAELAARTAIALAYADDPDGCVHLAAELPPARRTATSAQAGLALAHGLARLVQGDAAGALATAEELLRPTVSVRSHAAIIELRLRELRIRALLLLGRFADAEQVARADHNTAVTEASEHHAAASGALLGLVLLQRGRAEAGSELLADACGQLRLRDPLSLLPVCLAARAYAAALLGDTVEGTALLEDARTRAAPLQPLTAWAGRAECWLLAQQGNVTAAAELATSVAQQASGPLLWHPELLHDVARLGHTGTATPLEALARATDSALIEAMAAHASALAEADPDALGAVADRFVQIGADLPAAEAQAQAASMLRETNGDGAADDAGERATVLAERCGDVTTAALSGDLVRLTAREREIALLVADGRSSREVADRLTVSIRTVDNHLHRVYTKLGIAGRAELADALRPPGTPEGSVPPARPTGELGQQVGS